MYKICQWNVLLDSSAPGCIDDSMRAYASDDCLSWASRSISISKRIEASADVILLEECSHDMYKKLKELLPSFASWHASELDVGSDVSELDVALLLRRSEFEIIGSPQCQRLHDLCSECDRPTLLLPEQPGDVKPTSYVLVTAALRRRDCADCIVVGGTHLRWEFGTYEAAAAKPLQARAAAEGLLRHASGAGAAGWVLCGDLNSGKDDEAYRILTDGSLTAADNCRPANGTALSSAFRAVHGAEPLFTRKKDTVASQYCLDYVLYGGRLAATTAGFGPGPPPYDPDGDGADLPCLPCADWPSDHLPLVVGLELRPP